MTLCPHPLPPIPEATVAAVQAAFPKGNRYVELRAEFGPLYDDQLFADVYPSSRRPVAVAPWRLALVVVMQYIEGLTDSQAADAVRRCMDWKYALSLELTDPGFDFTLLHDFRQRFLAHAASQRFLDTFLAACKARGWIKTRGTQRTDCTHVLAAIRTLHRLECVLEAMHYALKQLSDVAPAWVRQQVPPEWYTRYGLRTDQARLPKDASKREALARQVGYVDADFLVTAQTQHQVDVVGPAFASYSQQHQTGPGYNLQAFVLDWDTQQTHCPQGHTSVHWRPSRDVSGDPVIRIRFDGATCRACPTRQACTSAQAAPRQLTVRPQVHHEAIRTARQRQETPQFKAQYALRAGVESSLSQGSRRFDFCQNRYLGLARTHLQQLLNATAMNIVRVIAWLWGEPLGERRRQPGHFGRLAPLPLSLEAVLCEG